MLEEFAELQRHKQALQKGREGPHQEVEVGQKEAAVKASHQVGFITGPWRCSVASNEDSCLCFRTLSPARLTLVLPTLRVKGWRTKASRAVPLKGDPPTDTSGRDQRQTQTSQRRT